MITVRLGDANVFLNKIIVLFNNVLNVSIIYNYESFAASRASTTNAGRANEALCMSVV